MSNRTYLPILTLTLWYVLTLVKFSCFSHNLHNCYDYPLHYTNNLTQNRKMKEESKETIALEVVTDGKNDKTEKDY